MIVNYILIALRNLRKNKIFSFINISGLAFGLACSVLIILWVNDEADYDLFHKDIDRIHIAMVHMSGLGNNVQIWQNTQGPLAPALKEEIPEIEEIARVDLGYNLLFRYGDMQFRERGGFSDASFFKLFSFPLKSGDPETVFSNPLSIVISEELAVKYFGDDDPIGKVLKVNDLSTLDLNVTGVFDKFPGNSSLEFDYLIPYETYLKDRPYMETWDEYGLRTFIKVREGVDIKELNTKVELFIADHHDPGNLIITLFFYPFRDFYLKKNVEGPYKASGRIIYVYLFTAIAAIILLIACINFMNLSTARAGKRSKEVGIRKASGAGRRSLIFQFLGESLGITFFAGFLGLLLAELMLPLFNYITTKSLIIPWESAGFLFGYLGILILTGLLAGSYPALYLSSFDPSRVLKGAFKGGKSMGGARRGLVIFQFTLSTTLIISTIIIYNQMQFIINKDLGLDKENVFYHSITNSIRSNSDAFYNELSNIPAIESYTRANFDPLNIRNSTYSPSWQGKPEDANIQFHIIQAESNFIETMGIELLEGKDLPERVPGDTNIYLLINEEAVRVIDQEDPIGMKINYWGLTGTVTGIVKNFHHHELYRDIEPVIVMSQRSVYGLNIIRAKERNIQEAIEGVENLYSRFEKEYPFEYRFIDEEFESRYENVASAGTLTNIFAFISIAVSCLGLFGLASYMTEQRKKETGIRKALGASVSRLTWMFSLDFLKLVAISIVLAIPLTYLAAGSWLKKFAYRIDLDPFPFLTGGLLAMVIALITVSYHTVKASKVNPVDSLRYE